MADDRIRLKVGGRTYEGVLRSHGEAVRRGLVDGTLRTIEDVEAELGRLAAEARPKHFDGPRGVKRFSGWHTAEQVDAQLAEMGVVVRADGSFDFSESIRRQVAAKRASIQTEQDLAKREAEVQKLRAAESRKRQG